MQKTSLSEIIIHYVVHKLYIIIQLYTLIFK